MLFKDSVYSQGEYDYHRGKKGENKYSSQGSNSGLGSH